MSSGRKRSFGLVVFVLAVLPVAVFAQNDAGRPEAGGVAMDPGQVLEEAGDIGRGGGEECPQSVRDWLAKLGDVGPEASSRIVAEACRKESDGDVETEITFEDEADTHSHGWIWVLRQWGLSILLYGLLMVPFWLIFRRRQQKLDEVMEGAEPAFEVDLSIEELKEDPSRLDGIRDLVDTVCIQRTPSSSAGGHGGASMRVSYTAFAIDAEGETHDILHSRDWAAVEEAAQWVADQCNAPLKDRTYG